MALKRVGTPKERMQKAHALIKQKNYIAARALLRGIDNPTAQQWRDKLDKILLEQDDPFADGPFSYDAPVAEVHTPENRPVDISQLGTVKMDLQSEAKLSKARKLIAARKYEKAREILVNIPHSMANEWIDKIDAIQADPFSQPAPLLQGSPSYDYSSKSQWSIIMFLFLTIPGHFITTMWYKQGKRDEEIVGHSLPGVGTLGVIKHIGDFFLFIVVAYLVIVLLTLMTI